MRDRKVYNAYFCAVGAIGVRQRYHAQTPKSGGGTSLAQKFKRNRPPRPRRSSDTTSAPPPANNPDEQNRKAGARPTFDLIDSGDIQARVGDLSAGYEGSTLCPITGRTETGDTGWTLAWLAIGSIRNMCRDSRCFKDYLGVKAAVERWTDR